jgi:hypothetical protein
MNIPGLRGPLMLGVLIGTIGLVFEIAGIWANIFYINLSGVMLVAAAMIGIGLTRGRSSD